MKVGNPIHDPLVDLGRGVLAVHGARGVADVVPDNVVGVRRESGGDVVCVLGSKVPLDEIHDPPLPFDVRIQLTRLAEDTPRRFRVGARPYGVLLYSCRTAVQALSGT